MRITDARTGRSTEIHPGRAGLLRVTVRAGQPGQPFFLEDLRALLTADLLARIVEATGPQVETRLSLPEAGDDRVTALLRDADLLGIRRPADITSTTGGPADLEIAARPGAGDDQEGTPLVTIGAVVPAGRADPSTAAGPLGSIPLDGLEPLAVRLALLGHAHEAPARLSAESLADAQATLTRWRAVVADLARFPSQPLVADAVRVAFDGLADDLDAMPALQALHDLEKRTELPPGARFETYLRVDQVLALELGREIGRQ
ncbi:hypothetical protein GCM10010193_41260 [Kitasatospora atroaurantiaca]|uniref:Uncharacterized protein n=1 Tax=Kitasatospora atroaurantiaca TaxID=285545 RepID=A0A561F1B4_9ACTN|nr:hypothetical protein [Kitasatospora atroaurantiaca]TWE21649.1 hypothetical protein FB465_6846 [Kitasatospora atroaurantiaca]